MLTILYKNYFLLIFVVTGLKSYFVLAKTEQAEFYKQVGILIKEARQKNKMKQELVANRVGLTRTSIVNIEQGEQKIQLHTLLELTKLFDMDITDFLPNINKYLNSNLSKQSEEKLSKELEKEKVTNTEDVSEILRAFIKYTQKHNS